MPKVAGNLENLVYRYNHRYKCSPRNAISVTQEVAKNNVARLEKARTVYQMG